MYKSNPIRYACKVVNETAVNYEDKINLKTVAKKVGVEQMVAT